MAVSDFEGRVDSIFAVEHIDNDGRPYVAFSIPKPVKKPIGLPEEKDFVFYYDLGREGAFAVISVIAAAFTTGLTLQVGLLKGANVPKGRVDWVQLIRKNPTLRKARKKRKA